VLGGQSEQAVDELGLGLDSTCWDLSLPDHLHRLVSPQSAPGGAIADALDKLQGIEGKTVIDATNLIGIDPPTGFRSNAEFVKSKTNGPTAKSFNINFAALYGRLGEARATSSNLWCGDDEAREVVEQLNQDAGYELVHTGPLGNAAAQESLTGIFFAISRGIGPFVYRIAPPDQL
jgi:predicted dinucleotide-binding enzyme